MESAILGLILDSSVVIEAERQRLGQMRGSFDDLLIGACAHERGDAIATLNKTEKFQSSPSALLYRRGIGTVAEEQQPKRTTDDRIDAIAMNLELLGHDLAELTRKMDQSNERMDQSNAQFTEQMALLKARMDQLTIIVQIDSDNIRILASVVGVHEERIASLEHPPQN